MAVAGQDIKGPGLSQRSFGIVLKCPRCPPKHYFAMLKIPSTKATPCPNCGSKLVRKE